MIRKPASPQPGDIDADRDLSGPVLTPEAMARSAFGRYYWGSHQERTLRRHQADADRRLAATRESWKLAAAGKAQAAKREMRRLRRMVRKRARSESGEESD